jgi:hypothetical protein
MDSEVNDQIEVVFLVHKVPFMFFPHTTLDDALAVLRKYKINFNFHISESAEQNEFLLNFSN